MALSDEKTAADVNVAPQNTSVATSGDKTMQHDTSPSVALAKFVISTTSSSLTENLKTKLKELFLDYLGVSASAATSSDSSPIFLKAILAFAGKTQGESTVLTKGSKFLPQYAALLNGAWCHTYDFDDTHADAVLHPGSSLISAALAEAESRDATGMEFILALAVGYEIACRLGMALGLGAYTRGFHNTGTAGLYGSIAAVCKLRGSSEEIIQNAFGLACSKAAGSMQFLENGSWNKRLHPGWAAHDALLCVELAEAGVIGSAKPLEGKYGVLHNYSESSDPSKLTARLGSDWVFTRTSCKPFPACRMTHGQIEMIGMIREEYRNHGVPEHMTITLAKDCFPIVGQPLANKIHPECIVDAQFSAYFQAAATWLYGDSLGWSVYEKITDQEVQRLCGCIDCELGDDGYKPLESNIKITFQDAMVVERRNSAPLGEEGKPFDWERGVKRKFLSLAEPVYGKGSSVKVCDTVERLEDCELRPLMSLLRWSQTVSTILAHAKNARN